MKKKNILKVHSAKGSCAAHVTRVDFNGEALYQFIYKGEAYDIVFNRFLPIGGDFFILSDGFAFETE